MTSAYIVRLSLIAQQNNIPSRHGPELVVSSQLDETLSMHLDTVYRYALRLTHDANEAQDLTQETMLLAWRNRRSIRSPDSVKSWLLQITTNRWTDQLRRGKLQPHLITDPPTSRETSTHKKVVQQEDVEQALAALNKLPSRQRQVVHLITIEKLSHSQVSEILGITPQAVKSNLAAGRKTLRKQLQDLYNEVRVKSS